MVGHGGSSAGSYLTDPTSPIPSHCASIVVTSTLRVNCISYMPFRKREYESVLMCDRHRGVIVYYFVFQVLGLFDEFEEAVRRVIRDVTFDRDIVVSVFETNIRMLG